MRVLGLDPGRHFAWSILETTRPKSTVIKRGVLEMPPDHLGLRRHPALEKLRALIDECQKAEGPDAILERIAIEVANEKVHGRTWGNVRTDKDAAAAASKSKHLLFAEHLAGFAHGVAFERGLGPYVELVAATEWRSALIRDAYAKDVVIRRVLSMRVNGLDGAKEHETDATGVALFVAERHRLRSMTRADLEIEALTPSRGRR